MLQMTEATLVMLELLIPYTTGSELTCPFSSSLVIQSSFSYVPHLQKRKDGVMLIRFSNFFCFIFCCCFFFSFFFSPIGLIAMFAQNGSAGILN